MHNQTNLRRATYFGFALALVLVSIPTERAMALSCLTVEDYLKSVVGNEETFIFVGTSLDRFDEKDYTAEVLTIDESLQGYIENTTFVYHTKDEVWGYLCNAGPGAEGSTGVYIANQDAFGKYQVSQRLPEDSPLIEVLEAALAEEEVTGEIYTIEKVDRLNQIKTIITDALAELRKLLKEYAYWK